MSTSIHTSKERFVLLTATDAVESTLAYHGRILEIRYLETGTNTGTVDITTSEGGTLVADDVDLTGNQRLRPIEQLADNGGTPVAAQFDYFVVGGEKLTFTFTGGAAGNTHDFFITTDGG
jgi:hypothetical protein